MAGSAAALFPVMAAVREAGMFHADLHIHSRFSRACSKDCDLPHLAWWARRKGITVVGTGDFTHPGWAEELKADLIPAEPGLLRLRPELDKRLRRDTPASCDRPVRFMLSVEISTIYRRDDRTRKVHHLLYAPGFAEADRITAALGKIGNLASDGRPILGLDSRDLLEITLNGGPGCYLVPAHVWTPWFAALGSKSGFDSVADCYADLADHIFAIETGLSSDPPMNWMCSVLDSYRLVSNSDAHSPPMLGREATTFATDLDYFAMAEALRTGDGLAGTIEFYPEEGKYHLDGHRKCGVRLEPEETRDYDGICPKCSKPLTVGVLHRVASLADRPLGYTPAGAAGSTNLIRLPEIVGELMSTGPRSKRVHSEVGRLVAAFGPELDILTGVPADDLVRVGGSLLGEAISRLRRGEVIREAGYDGEYGTIRVMRPDELQATGTLFDIVVPDPPSPREEPVSERLSQVHSAPVPRSGARPVPAPDEGTTPALRAPAGPAAANGGPGAAGEAAVRVLLEGLDPRQRAAATAVGPVLIVAGPGTGKTRTLTHRIACLIAGGSVRAGQCLAITFTRRAAEEMRLRLAALIGPAARQITVTTFHGLGLAILRENAERAGLAEGFGVADDAARLAVATELAGSAAAGRRLLAATAADPAEQAAFRAALTERGLVDFDSLVELPLALLRREPALAAALRRRWPSISVDEYQDVDQRQYELLRLLSSRGAADGPAGAAATQPTGTAGTQPASAAVTESADAADGPAGAAAAQPAGAGLTVIGDPDQAIYSFRGSDAGFFLRFTADHPNASRAELTTSYRSAPDIVASALQAVAPATLLPGRTLRAAGPAPGRVVLHEAPDEQAEAEWITAQIDQLLGGASFHSLDSGRADGHGQGGLGLNDIAVLYRTDAQAEPLTRALTRAGLPFQKRSHDRLARRAGVREIVAEMRLTAAAEPAAEARERIPAARGYAPDGRGVADDLGPDSQGPEVRHLVRAAVRRLAARAQRGRAADIRAAGEILLPLAGRCGRDMHRFLTEIAIGAEADALDPRAEAVPLLTVHAAKGLEFEVVFLAGCERGLLPLWLPGDAAGQAVDPAEERRLLFVAMTRARSLLLMSCAATRTRYGSGRPAGPSPFLTAIDPALLHRTAPRRPRPPAARQLKLL
ncbi:MAG TPA: UvrD-helicase domain-containing protein [Streptosporangiaceae bacterium]